MNELFLFRRDTQHCGTRGANNGNQCRPVILPSRRNERRRFRKRPAQHKRGAISRARMSHTRDDNGRFVRDLAFTDCQSGLRERDKESPRITNNSRSRVILDLAWEIAEYLPRIYFTYVICILQHQTLIIASKNIFIRKIYILKKTWKQPGKYF